MSIDVSSTSFERLKTCFELARKLFLADGMHPALLFLLIDGEVIKILSLSDFDTSNNEALLEVAQEPYAAGTDGVIIISEAWAANRPWNGPPSEAPDRFEVLLGLLVTKSGLPVQISAPIQRSANEVTLDESVTEHGGVPFLLEPFYRLWGIELPSPPPQALAN